MKKLFLLVAVMLSLSKHQSSFAQAPHLWVTAQFGGANDAGTLLESDSTGLNFHVVYNFNHPVSARPTDNLLLAPNGKLYGTSLLGGYTDSCTIYFYDTATDVCDSIYNFMYHPEYGDEPLGGLMLANSGMIYGTASDQLLNGVIFMFNPSTELYTMVYGFGGFNGGTPQGGLMQATDGNLYGMTTGNQVMATTSVIYRFNPVTHAYRDLFDFTDSSGNSPSYGHLIQASDGKLYGLTCLGGMHNKGTLFSFNPADSVFTRLYNFSNTQGSNPGGSLMQASNGKLYGMTGNGGDNGVGVIFSYDIVNSNYTKLYDFVNVTGMHPSRSLNQGSNGLFFGTTWLGGAYGFGTIFSYDVIGNTYTDLLDFDSTTTGKFPGSDITETPRVSNTSVTNLTTNHNPLTIYPNPVADYLTVQGLASNIPIEITDVAGRVLYSQKATSSAQIDMRGYQAGVYLLKAGGEVRKVVKL